MAEVKRVTSEIWGRVEGSGEMHLIGTVVYDGTGTLSYEEAAQFIGDFIEAVNLVLVERDKEAQT